MNTQTTPTKLNLASNPTEITDADFMLNDKSYRPLVKSDIKNPFIFVIPDLYGRFDLLDRMIKTIESPEILGFEFGATDKVVFLGRYVGVNGNTYETFKRLRKYKQKREANAVFLRSRIDQQFLRFNNKFAFDPLGAQVRESYRYIPTSKFVADQEGRLEARDLSTDRLFVLHGTKLFYENDKMIICNSGMDTTLKLHEQKPHNFMYSRFKNEEDVDFGKLVIHGDALTPKDKPHIKKHRVCLDTGANVYGNGILTCGVFNANTAEMVDVLTVK